MGDDKRVKSVAIIGAGAAGSFFPPLFPLQRKNLNNQRIPGAVTAAAFSAEDYFERIRVFERRGAAGGTWYVLHNHHISQLTTHLATRQDLRRRSVAESPRAPRRSAKRYRSAAKDPRWSATNCAS